MKRRGLTDREAQSLMEYLDSTDEQHALIIQLLMLTGLRTHELWPLRTSDLDLVAGTLTVWNAAKGSTGRVIGLPQWYIIRARGKVLSQKDRDGAEQLVVALGYGSEGGSVATFKSVLRRSWQVVKRRVFGDRLKLGLHSLRHTFALKVYSITKNPLAVQNVLGHKSFKNTEKYLRYADEPLQIAATRSIYENK